VPPFSTIPCHEYLSGNGHVPGRVTRRHRFTEPTPVSGRSGPVVSVLVSGWEIECCAPQPTVGEMGQWRLSFIPAEKSRDPALDGEHEWLSAPWPDPVSPSASCLSDGSIRVHWGSPTATSIPQRIRLRGHVFGTKHGGTEWDDFPSTTALVTRVQLVTSEFAKQEQNSYFSVVRGTTTLVDVDRSPKWFPGMLIPDEFGRRISTHGVLIDLICQE
jgi:Family of unknown function (DUF6578)